MSIIGTFGGAVPLIFLGFVFSADSLHSSIISLSNLGSFKS